MARDGGYIEYTEQFSGSDIISQLETNPSYSSTAHRYTTPLTYVGTTGATVTDTGSHYIFEWTTPGTYIFSPDSDTEAEVLIVGGGGAGGSLYGLDLMEAGGGGGGGSVLYTSRYQRIKIHAGNTTVVVGSGGQYTTSAYDGDTHKTGGFSSMGSIIALGGSHAGQGNTCSENHCYGNDHGSGGGAVNPWCGHSYNARNPAAQLDYSGFESHHHGGGSAVHQGAPGGGGGAGGPGQNAPGSSRNHPGNDASKGGAGIMINITGSNVSYGGGGDGGLPLRGHLGGKAKGSASPDIGGGGLGGGCTTIRWGCPGDSGNDGKDGAVIIKVPKLAASGGLEDVSMRAMHNESWQWARAPYQVTPGPDVSPNQGRASYISGSDVFGVLVKVKNVEDTTYDEFDNGRVYIKMLGGSTDSGGSGWKVGVKNVTDEDTALSLNTDGAANPSHDWGLTNWDYHTLTDSQSECVIGQLGSGAENSIGTVIDVNVYDAAAVDVDSTFYFTFRIWIGNGSTGAYFQPRLPTLGTKYAFTSQSEDNLSDSIECWTPGEDGTFDRYIVN